MSSGLDLAEDGADLLDGLVSGALHYFGLGVQVLAVLALLGALFAHGGVELGLEFFQLSLQLLMAIAEFV